MRLSSERWESMRSFVTMLVVASGDEYAEAMLTALRA